MERTNAACEMIVNPFVPSFEDCKQEQKEKHLGMMRNIAKHPSSLWLQGSLSNSPRARGNPAACCNLEIQTIVENDARDILSFCHTDSQRIDWYSTRLYCIMSFFMLIKTMTVTFAAVLIWGKAIVAKDSKLRIIYNYTGKGETWQHLTNEDHNHLHCFHNTFPLLEPLWRPCNISAPDAADAAMRLRVTRKLAIRRVKSFNLCRAWELASRNPAAQSKPPSSHKSPGCLCECSCRI